MSTYLYPVIVRISNESNMLHLSILKTLDKLDLQFLESLTSLLDIIHNNSNMTETTTRLLVAIGIGKVSIILGAPVAI